MLTALETFRPSQFRSCPPTSHESFAAVLWQPPPATLGWLHLIVACGSRNSSRANSWPASPATDELQPGSMEQVTAYPRWISPDRVSTSGGGHPRPRCYVAAKECKPVANSSNHGCHS